jgi:hypothetical protein
MNLISEENKRGKEAEGHMERQLCSEFLKDEVRLRLIS